MGKDLIDEFAAARAIFEQADDILGFPLSRLCFEGPEEALNDTINTQPALLTCGIAMLRALESLMPDAKPAMMAGHSLGEFTALVGAEVLSFEDGLRLVRERGRLMKQAGERNPGAMAAILGLDVQVVDNICKQVSLETSGMVIVANDNCPGQLVISGHNEAVTAAMQKAQEVGARRVVRLAVSIAAHSPLMEPAADAFRSFLEQVEFRAPAVPVYANASADVIPDIQSIRHELATQLTQPVRWTESIQAMIAAGANHFVEVGPKDVLTGLIKRIDRGVQRTNLNSSLTLREISG